MGRLFAQETNKTSTSPKTTKGRLFTTPLVKKTLGEKVLNTGTAVSTFFGGKAVADKIGAKIAKAGAAPGEAQYIEEPTKKQVVASAGELGLNILGLVPGVGVAAKSIAAANKVRYGALAVEGAAYAGSQAALRGVQDQKSSKEILKDVAVNTAIGAVAGPLVGRLFKGKVKKPVSGIVEDTTPVVSQEVPTELPKQDPDLTYEPIKEPQKKSSLPVIQMGESPAPKPRGSVIPVEMQQTPQQVPIPTVKDPIRVLEDAFPDNGADPVIRKTSFEEQKSLYDTTASTTSTDDLIDMSMGRKPLPEGLQKNAVYELTKNRADLTPEQVRRLANTAPESEAGLNLVLTKLRQGGIIDNATDMVKVIERQLKEGATKNGITKKTIKRFLDDIGCTM